MKKQFHKLLLPLLLALVVVILFQTIFLIGFVPTASMEPTLKEGSLILGIRPHGRLKTGDIIIFRHDEHMLVKRIAAVGGETIEVDGTTYNVPDNSFFVLGDNGENSLDSRYWPDPYVSVADVLAKLLLS